MARLFMGRSAKRGDLNGSFATANSMTVARCVLAATEFSTNPLLIGTNAGYARPMSGQMLEFCV